MLHHALTLELNADSAECCPTRGLRHVLAVGTYQLDEASQQRHGRLYIYQLQQVDLHCSPELQSEPPATRSTGSAACCAAAHPADGPGQSPTTPKQDQLQLQHACSLDMPGIFDLKWRPTMGSQSADSKLSSTCLGAALADGSLRLFQVQLQDDTQHAGSHVELQESMQCQAVQPGNMALSLDWHPVGDLVAVSGSAGNVAVVQVREEQLQTVIEWQAHELEVWCAAFNVQQPSIVYTGSDDCCFKAWDIRTHCPALNVQAECDDPGSTQAPCSPGQSPTCMHNNRKVHAAGVCTISPHPSLTHVLATGSYDERVRIWDIRMPTKPTLSTEVQTGGGNWRLRWHPTRPDLLVAACMYNGFAVLQAQHNFSKLQLVEHYKGHNSIAYGVDWFRSHCLQDSLWRTAAGTCDTDDDMHLIASCSFYDKLLHLWTPSVPL